MGCVCVCAFVFTDNHGLCVYACVVKKTDTANRGHPRSVSVNTSRGVCVCVAIISDAPISIWPPITDYRLVDEVIGRNGNPMRINFNDHVRGFKRNNTLTVQCVLS